MFSFADQSKMASQMLESAQQQAAIKAFDKSQSGRMLASQTAEPLASGASIFQDNIDSARAKRDSVIEKIETATTDAQRKRYESQLKDYEHDARVWSNARDSILGSNGQ